MTLSESRYKLCSDKFYCAALTKLLHPGTPYRIDVRPVHDQGERVDRSVVQQKLHLAQVARFVTGVLVAVNSCQLRI